jgi:hypothetical protein
MTFSADLTGKKALVTGASSEDLGKHFACRCSPRMRRAI